MQDEQDFFTPNLVYHVNLINPVSQRDPLGTDNFLEQDLKICRMDMPRASSQGVLWTFGEIFSLLLSEP